MADRSIAVKLRAEVGQYQAEMKKAAAATQEVGTSGEQAAEKGKRSFSGLAETAKANEVQWRRTGTALIAAGTAVAAVGAAALRTGVDYNTLQQTSRAALTTLLGSAEAANAQMDKLDEFAKTSPFSKQTFITAQQQMLAFGIEAQKVVPYLDAIQNAVAASGGSNDDIAGITATISKIQSSAKITAEDLNEFGGRGVNAAELIGSQMGKTGAQIREEITAGTLGADQALDALTAGMAQRFDGAADNVKNTFDGAMDRVKAAWRDLSSALAQPFVGSEGGGLFTALLNELADAMRAFEDLPGPVKTAGVAIAGIGGAGSIAAGTFLLLAPRIQETREALAKMGPRASAAAGLVGRLAKGAGVLAVAFTTVQAASKVFTQDDIPAGMESWTKALLGAADGSEASIAALEKLSTVKAPSFLGISYTDDVNGLADAIGNLDTGKWGRFLSMGGPGASSLESSAIVLERTDAVLASLVQSGNLEEAGRLFDYVAGEGAKSGTSVEALRDLLPQYGDALDGVSNGQRLAGDTASQAADQFKALQEAIAGGSESFIDFVGAMKDGKASLTDFMENLEKQAKAQAEWGDNMARAAERGVSQGVLEELAKLGPEGARMVADLANATDAEISRMNDIVAGLGDSYDSLPDVVVTAVQLAGYRDVLNKIAVLSSAMMAIPGVSSPIFAAINIARTVTNSTANADGGFYDGRIKTRASGGFDDYGRAVPRVPQIRQAAQGAVLWGEPETGWEAYISGKPGMEDRNRAILGQAADRLGMSVGGNGYSAPLPSGGGTAMAVRSSLAGVEIGFDSRGVARIARGEVVTQMSVQSRHDGGTNYSKTGKR